MVHGYCISLRGFPEIDNHLVKGGVGIIFCPQAIIAWIYAGALLTTLGKIIAGDAHFVSIKLIFEHKKEQKLITLVSSYHPNSGCSTDDLNQFFQLYDDFINNETQ